MTAQIRRLLVSGGIISPFDFAPGFPALLPTGLSLVERMHALYEAEIRSFAEVAHVEASPLLDAREYRDSYNVTHDYTNVYEIDDAESPLVLRPDGLRELVGHGARSGRDLALVCRRPLFRAETTDAQPLIRERHLWGVAQMVHQVRHGSTKEAWNAHSKAFLRLMDAMLIPTLVVEAPPLREHARRRILTFSRTPDGRTWLTCTLYHLADEFVSGLGARGPVIELGYTAKLIAMGVALHQDDRGVCLPSRLSPTQVLIPTGSDARVRHALRGLGLRIADGKSDWTATLRMARRIGTPLVAAPHVVDGVRVYIRGIDTVRTVRWGLLDAAVREALADHDTALWQRAEAAQAPFFDGEGDGTGVVGEGQQHPGLFTLGRVVEANTGPGREAARKRAVLVSHKQRIY